MSKGITSVEGLIRAVFKYEKRDNELVFYRGHSDRDNFKLLPSIMRLEKFYRNESEIHKEIIISNPEEFLNDRTEFDRLVRMQHYLLPTRLLDITTNPLIALYFSCHEKPDLTGEVIRFRVPKSLVKFYDSDTVSCISNLSKLSFAEKSSIRYDIATPGFNIQEAVKKLGNYVKEEKPYFVQKIDPNDLTGVICVKCKFDNNRSYSQSGAFFIFGHGANENSFQEKGISIERVSIKSSAKSKIMSELDSLSINIRTVFPEIEYSAKYIRASYD